MSDSPPRSVIHRLADVAFYGPLGLVLERRRLFPELAQRGRRQIAFTHTVGRFTIRQGQSRLQGLVEGVTGSPREDPSEPEPQSTASALSANGSTAAIGAGEPVPSAASLAIPQYDSLSAIQVVPRLDALSATELGDVQAYESATRARRTILAKISQLLQ